jgi:hypothetical protein
LVDPTVRAVVEKLTRGPAPVSDLARPFQMAPPSFLSISTRSNARGWCDLTKKGRVRAYRSSPAARGR